MKNICFSCCYRHRLCRVYFLLLLDVCAKSHVRISLVAVNEEKQQFYVFI